MEKRELEELAREAQKDYADQIILAKVNGRLKELTDSVTDDDKVEWITVRDSAGSLTYRRTATLIMLKAAYDVIGRRKIDKITVEFSLSKGYYCNIIGKVDVNDVLLAEIEGKMREIVDADIKLHKQSIKTSQAVADFGKHGMHDKEKLFRFRRSSKVNVYTLGNFTDYFYGYMAPSTGYIQNFKIFGYDEGFVLQFPSSKDPSKVAPFEPQHNLYSVLKETNKWGTMMGVETVGDLNELITKGELEELILVQEALQERKLAQIAADIASDPHRKFIMIAGPSSSGKTTTSYRLCIQLRAAGLRPHQLSLDNYFVDREHTPRDENGDYNFECLEALDVEGFNKDMTDLLNGKTVQLPTFNFRTGAREYNGNTMTLGPEDVMVIEGIHGLNDRLSYTLPKESKYKIYLSALTSLNIDEHNRIPTTDARLLRRIVRDARTRGASAIRTIQMWDSVRRGEEENIFPFQESADVIFNSALIYEFAVLKAYAEPLLFSIGEDEPEYAEAKRLLKFLDYFLSIGTDNIPINSIMREFVGGSCFNV